MRKVFFLKTCGTCKKILSEFDWSAWYRRELKNENVTEEELEVMYQMTHSYEALFNKKSTQIKIREIDLKSLNEDDFKKLILDHYSFLKRPVVISEDVIFIGNDKKTIEKLRNYFHQQ